MNEITVISIDYVNVRLGQLDSLEHCMMRINYSNGDIQMVQLLHKSSLPQCVNMTPPVIIG